MATNRSQEEIVNRINLRKGKDFFGFEINEYIGYLTFDNARPFIKGDAVKEEWESAPAPQDPVMYIKDYMGFAWDKANNQRGISASRSVMHMIAWLWLAGEDELADWCADFENNYYHYGKPILQKICEHYEIDWKSLDDGERTNG